MPIRTLFSLLIGCGLFAGIATAQPPSLYNDVRNALTSKWSTTAGALQCLAALDLYVRNDSGALAALTPGEMPAMAGRYADAEKSGFLADLLATATPDALSIPASNPPATAAFARARPGNASPTDTDLFAEAYQEIDEIYAGGSTAVRTVSEAYRRSARLEALSDLLSTQKAWLSGTMDQQREARFRLQLFRWCYKNKNSDALFKYIDKIFQAPSTL